MKTTRTTLETMTALRLCLMGRLDSCLECPYRELSSSFFNSCSDQLYFDVQQYVLKAAETKKTSDQ